MAKYVADSAAAKSVSAWIVTNKRGQFVAKVQALHTASRVTVNVFDRDSEFQTATASGYGCDKLTAALAGLTIGGHRMTDNCGENRKPPRGARIWARDAKCPRGFQFANWVSISKETGRVMRHYDFVERATLELGFAGDAAQTREQADSIHELAVMMKRNWRDSDDCESGWADCYRLPGLDYIRAMGLNVYRAI